MASRTQGPAHRQDPIQRVGSDNPRYGDASEFPDDGSFQQSANITNGRRESLSRGGGFRNVSPGGEYLSGAPREYSSEAYSEQGFGKKTRADTHWRTEDRIFGAGSVINEPTPGQQGTRYRGLGPKGYRRSDERIREDACEALEDDLFLDASQIEVQASESEVTLEGTVHSRDDKRRAEHLIESIRGVRDIHNRLRVQP